jgi:3-oxosteroid 1-dehydrogenase
MSHWDETTDLVIVGSGGGSLCAALVAQDQGRRAIVLEKTDQVGGSTAMSGGVLWIPANPLMAPAGRPDSLEKGRAYLEAVVGPEQPGSTHVRRDAFLRHGPRMVSYLADKGMKWFLARHWPDYYADRVGGEPVSRSILAEMFDLKELGPWASRLRTYPGFDMPLHSDDFPDLVRLKTTWAGKKAALRMAGRMGLDLLTGRKTRGQGAALQGRLLQIALRNQVAIHTDSPVTDLVIESGRVTGVVVRSGGRERRIAARSGVLLNTGGFARNAQLRQKYQRPPVSANWSSANPGDTGDLLETVRGLGAATHNLDAAVWVLTTRMPDGSPSPGQVLPDGTDLPYIHVVDIGKPHLIMVDAKGQRFCNESGSYMEMGERMLEAGAVPAWVITDSRHRQNYPWGRANPGQTPKDWLASGFLKRAATLEELARTCGIDANGLQQTVARFNGFCAAGIDTDFGRGADAYGRWVGDPSVQPNPALGAIAQPPYYAMAVFPGDVGTYGGFVCDEHARVQREDGSVIEGLYATGNCTASVTGRAYPGAGASIAASFVFGYLAAHHACGRPLAA